MPPGKGKKKPASKSSTTRRGTNRVTRKTGQQAGDSSSTALAVPSNIKQRLRSKTLTRSDLIFQENPDLCLSKAHRSQKAREAAEAQDRLERETSRQLDRPIRSIETPLTEDYRRFEYEDPDDLSGEGAPSSLHYTDPEEIFNREWGYLPPLDEETVAMIDAIMADPDKVAAFKRIGPEKIAFAEGLEWRNVFLDESAGEDSEVDFIKNLTLEKSGLETGGVSESHGLLWSLDQAKCNEGSNEALFQRTVMMSLIARHCLIYNVDASNSRYLDFSVEETWGCPPMPTRAYQRNGNFLTQPKPDLAVCFYKDTLIPPNIWINIPTATRQLCCYETSQTGQKRAFHFLTVEAKKWGTVTDDPIAKFQSLNNASQALHNMFEFFKDAGPEHKDIFFAKVRFFSVVASTEGIVIRIHRATDKPADNSDQGLIMDDVPEYPLRFEHRKYCSILKSDFDRKTVLDTFEKILVGYGVGVLRLLLQSAAKAIAERLKTDPKGMEERTGLGFYRYGQTKNRQGSRTRTPASNRARSEMGMSVDVQSGKPSPAASRAPSVPNKAADEWSGRTTATGSRPGRGKKRQWDVAGEERNTRPRYL